MRLLSEETEHHLLKCLHFILSRFSVGLDVLFAERARFLKASLGHEREGVSCSDEWVLLAACSEHLPQLALDVQVESDSGCLSLDPQGFSALPEHSRGLQQSLLFGLLPSLMERCQPPPRRLRCLTLESFNLCKLSLEVAWLYETAIALVSALSPGRDEFFAFGHFNLTIMLLRSSIVQDSRRLLHTSIAWGNGHLKPVVSDCSHLNALLVDG